MNFTKFKSMATDAAKSAVAKKSHTSYVGKRDAGAIAAKKMRDKEQQKYVGFLPANEGIKYDSKGSSMDYFLGADPKKTKEYKALKKKKTQKEGTSYGLYKGSGKPSGAMKKYLDRKAKMLTKKRDAQSDAAKNNPHFDSTQPSPSGRNKYEQMTPVLVPKDGANVRRAPVKKTQSNNDEKNKYEQVTFQQFQEKCWPGYEKKGMKTMFGKRYPNCVKKKK